MEPLRFSFIVPVYNRPDEIDELLNSITGLKGNIDFEVVIVEDGSDLDCKSIVEAYSSKLRIAYYYKSNSGPGASRNYGMKRAKGNYFIILDSDCLLPDTYLETVHRRLSDLYVDCYGGPDAAHPSFTNLQKAINFAMTSFMTTGGIRGGKNKQKKFQPRSFNMGISKMAFELSGGFGDIHPGEDPDLAIRLTKLGFETILLHDAFVYHKRRISWLKFYEQVHKFGMVRPILNLWYPETKSPIYWFPTLFCLGMVVAIIALAFGYLWPLLVYVLYIALIFLTALFTTGNVIVAFQSIVAIFIQFLGYGYGFLTSTLKLLASRRPPRQQFPNLFFNHVK